MLSPSPGKRLREHPREPELEETAGRFLNPVRRAQLEPRPMLDAGLTRRACKTVALGVCSRAGPRAYVQFSRNRCAEFELFEHPSDT